MLFIEIFMLNINRVVFNTRLFYVQALLIELTLTLNRNKRRYKPCFEKNTNEIYSFLKNNYTIYINCSSHYIHNNSD